MFFNQLFEHIIMRGEGSIVDEEWEEEWEEEELEEEEW